MVSFLQFLPSKVMYAFLINPRMLQVLPLILLRFHRPNVNTLHFTDISNMDKVFILFYLQSVLVHSDNCVNNV
jgi:hypothetical protein